MNDVEQSNLVSLITTLVRAIQTLQLDLQPIFELK